MKIRFWLGCLLIAIVAGLFAVRGEVGGWIVEKWEKRGVPRSLSVEQIQKERVSRPSSSLSPESSPIKEGEGAVVPHPSSPTLAKAGGYDPLSRGEEEIVEFPVEFNLAVPFTSQAPFAVWDEVHDDACEEASVMMVDAFFKGRTFTPQTADTEIYSLVDWQTQNLGYWKDTNVEETARMLREVYGYKNVRIVENPTVEMIKREIFAGRPVIVPAAGQMLGNPYFRGAGPPYHMLVVRGWAKDGRMITNDPGTKRGNAFLYAPEVLLNAIHDWTGSDETIKQGRKVMIVAEE